MEENNDSEIFHKHGAWCAVMFLFLVRFEIQFCRKASVPDPVFTAHAVAQNCQ